MRALPLLLVALCLAGCSPGEYAAVLEGPVTYVRSGGVAGVSERIVIRPDGSGRRSSGRGTRARGSSFRVPDDQLAEVVHALEGWAGVPPDQRGSEPAPDALAYAVRYRGHLVRTVDGAERDVTLARVLHAITVAARQP